MALLHLVTVALLWVAAAMPLPIDRSQQPVLNCDSIDKYNLTWFLNNAKPEYRRPIVGKALFYTAGASEPARRLACDSNEEYVTIWQIWHPELYNEELTSDNPLRCIHQNPSWKNRYYSSMSDAYARMARGSATVMHMAKDFRNPPLHGIWGKIELPALRDKTDVKMMKKITEDRGKSEDWPLLNKGTEDMVKSAMAEIANIFSSTPSPRARSNSEACELWSSMKGSFLDQKM